ncbi:ABC transporter permease [Pseudonocardia sp. CA-107938]|uniref:ABC transporter permease n=1 Tax=Pseudonocardia sp. CA-107938 TaxID=3240021 RepID=UPI003D90E78F
MSAPLSSGQAIGLVARREFVTQVRSRSFVIGLLITLVLFGVVGAISAFVAGQRSTSTVGITPDAASLTSVLDATAHAKGLTLQLRDVTEEAGRSAVAADELDALLTGTPGHYALIGRDAVDDQLADVVRTAARQVAVAEVLQAAGTDAAALDARSAVTEETLEPVDPDRGQRLALAIVGTILLFVSLSAYGQLVATGVVEEKQSRVVELLLATIKPWELLAGKIIGLGAVGLLNLVILGGVAAAGGAAFGLLTLPAATIGLFAMVIVWYVLGFFLFAALYAAVGSTVSRQEELNTVVAPMIFILLVPFILTVNLLPSDPRSPLATVLSYVPFFSQTVMPARYALGAAELWEVAVAALIAALAIAVVVRVAGRVYRNSVLRTGARVSLREALRG